MQVPGVVAVTLGGSRAGGVIHPDSDWDFGLYYRDTIRADDVRGLGFDGTVVEPGAWGRLVNGGAWLTVEGQRVDLSRPRRRPALARRGGGRQVRGRPGGGLPR